MEPPRVIPANITCPRCGRTSWSPEDVKHGYCGHCHDWTSDPLGSDDEGGVMYLVQRTSTTAPDVNQ